MNNYINPILARPATLVNARRICDGIEVFFVEIVMKRTITIAINDL